MRPIQHHLPYLRSYAGAAAACLLVLTPGRAEVRLGNKGALAFGLDADLEHDSNIQANNREDGDFIATVLPKVLYRFDEGELRLDAFAGMQVREYDEQSQFDSTNFKSRVEATYPAAGAGERNYEFRFRGGYNESASADSDLQTIVERDTTTAAGSLRYFIADRYWVKGAVDYRGERTEDFNDVDRVAFPVDFFYRYSEDLSVGFGYRFRTTDVDGAAPSPDSEDHAVYLALTGRLAPSVEAELRVGMQEREFDSPAFEDDDAFYAEGRLEWTAAERTRVDLTVGNELVTNAASSSVEETYAEVGLRHRLDEKISARVGAGYLESDFQPLKGGAGRTDEEWFVSLDVDYVLVDDRLILSGGLRHSDQDSDLSTASYDRSRARIAVELVY